MELKSRSLQYGKVALAVRTQYHQLQFVLKVVAICTDTCMSLVQTVRSLLLPDFLSVDPVASICCINRSRCDQHTWSHLQWIHNWLNNRTHSTKFAKEVSKVSAVTASIIQGSGLGPCSSIPRYCCRLTTYSCRQQDSKVCWWYLSNCSRG